MATGTVKWFNGQKGFGFIQPTRHEFGRVPPTGAASTQGRLVAGSYEFDIATQTIEVAVEFPNPDYLLRPVLNVTVHSSIRAK